MADGYSRKATAKELGIDYKTFLAYMDRHDEFREAVEEGDSLAEVYWQQKYEDGALGKNKDVNASMMIFYMKNRFKWTDRMEQQVTTDVQLPTLDEWQQQD
ncbi:hypothetical protein [Endozoicomonas sp. Mp262]|uniref:hypothetical protein n=1 Tax=Endozoicomonas sp. Mp262 TaxID=2919499 RepID=UPI0021DA9ACD